MKLYSALIVLASTAEGHGEGGPLFHLFGLPVSGFITTMWALILFLTVVSILATRKLSKVPESKLQNFMEFVLVTILGYLTQVMGDEERAKKYFPLLASFFLLILCSNYSGLIPGMGRLPGMNAPTSTLSVTAAFAIIVFFATHYYGIKSKGIKYFKHFVEPIWFIFPLNVIEEFVKPLSLSLRLYGNVYGEEMVVGALFALVPLFVPLPMMLLGILFGLIQAFVFTLLATLYIATATADHH